MTTMTNLGEVRGGCNAMARLHLHFKSPDGDEVLYSTLWPVWAEEFGFKNVPWTGDGGPNNMSLWFQLNNRRQFAILPAMLRKAARIGWAVYLTIWDVGPKGEVHVGTSPAQFWEQVALAQAYVGQ